jgi:hypothetical protein
LFLHDYGQWQGFEQKTHGSLNPMMSLLIFLRKPMARSVEELDSIPSVY